MENNNNDNGDDGDRDDGDDNNDDTNKSTDTNKKNNRWAYPLCWWQANVLNEKGVYILSQIQCLGLFYHIRAHI